MQTPLEQLPKFSRQGENNTDWFKYHGGQTHRAIFHLIFILSFVLPSLNLMESTGILLSLNPGHWILVIDKRVGIYAFTFLIDLNTFAFKESVLVDF